MMRYSILLLLSATLLSACGASATTKATTTSEAAIAGAPVVIAGSAPTITSATSLPATIVAPDATSVSTNAVPTSIPTSAAPTSAATNTSTSAAPTSAATSTSTSAAPTSAAPLPTPTTALEAAPTAEQSGQASIPAIPDTIARTALEPTAPPVADQALVLNPPIRIAIPTIGLDTRIVSVGLDANRVPIVPDHNVGWYNLSATPGQGENIVLWGHVLRFRNAPNIPAPFADLKLLQPGALITLYDGHAQPYTYRVTQQVRVTPDQVEYILPQGKELLTLVSCIGDSVIVHGEVVDKTHRLITIAEPAS